MKKRGRKVSHKARVELILDAQKMRNDLERLRDRLGTAEAMIKKTTGRLTTVVGFHFSK